MQKPDLKPSPLLDPKLLRTLPIATRMYVIGNFVRDLLQYTQSREIELFKGNTLVNNQPTPAAKTVNVITKPNSPRSALPNEVGGQLASAFSTQPTPILQNLQTYVINDVNPINSFFNMIADQNDLREPVEKFPNNNIIKKIEEVLNIAASQFGVNVVDIFKEDVETLSDAIKLFQDFVKSENGIMFNPAILSSKFPEETKNFKAIKSKLFAYEKNALNTLYKGVEALENLMTPILNLEEGHSINDQRWNINNRKPIADGTPIGSIIDAGDVVDRNDPGLLRNIKIHNKQPVEMFSALVENTATDAVKRFIPYAENLFNATEKVTLYPTAKQFHEILEDLGIDVDTKFRKENRKKLLEQAYDEFINIVNTTESIEDIEKRPGKLQKAFSNLFAAHTDGNVVPNFDYQLFSNVEKLRDEGFLLGRKASLSEASAKEKAVIFLHEILYDPSVNNNFQNIEKILASIVAESKLDVNYYDKEGYNFDIFGKSNYNDVNANKAWLADTFVNSVKGKKALIENLNPEFGSLLFPNKETYSKYADTIKDIPENLKALIHTYADNFGIDWMADSDNFKQVMDAVQKEDPAAFAKINKYYNSVEFRDSVKNRKELFKFKPTNWQDKTNVYVYRQVQNYLSSHPNLDKTKFTDEVIRSGIKPDGLIDETSKLFSLLEELRDVSPEFILALEGKISSIMTNAQEAVQVTQNAFQGLDAKVIPALMNKKHNVASLGQMMVAAQTVLTNHTHAMLDVEGIFFKLQNNPNANLIKPTNFSPFDIYSDMFIPDGQLIGQGYPDLEYGIGSEKFDFSEVQYLDPKDIPEERKFTIYGIIDDLMMNKVRIAEDAKYPVILDDEFAVLDRNTIIDEMLSELQRVIADPMMREDFVKLVVSNYGDTLPPIARIWYKHESLVSHTNSKLRFPTKFNEKYYGDVGSVRHGDRFSTMAEFPNGEKINVKFPGMTSTYSSQFNFLNDTVNGQDFTNHVFISAAKELFAQGYEDIATSLLDIEDVEVDIWREFDDDVLKELKKILITELDRGNGGEIAMITTTTGGESPTVATKNTLRTASFDTLGHAVLEGQGARAELMIAQDNMKVVDFKKWTPITRNNALGNSILLIPNQGEKVINGALQQLQDPLNPPNIINLTEQPQSGLGVKLQEVVGTAETGEEFVPEYPFNWLDRGATNRNIHPVNGKYQIGKNVSAHANTLIEGKTPTQIPIELLPTGLSDATIKQYLKNKNVNNIDDVVNKKNFVIQTMQKAARDMQNFLKGSEDSADLSVAYIKVDELLKFVEDNRAYREGQGTTLGLGNINKIAQNIIKDGFKQPDIGLGSTVSGYTSSFVNLLKDLPVVRFNPNNNAILLQEGNHRVQAMKMLGIDYIPVFFQLDPQTLEGRAKTKFSPLGAIGTNEDVSARTAGGSTRTRSYYDEGLADNANWKRLAKYIHDPEINKNMFTPLSTVSDYTLHPNYGSLAMYQNLYLTNEVQLRQYSFLEPYSIDKAAKMERVINNNMKYFRDTATTAFENLDIAVEGIKQWFMKHGTKQDKEAVQEFAKLHPTKQDLAAYFNTIQNVEDPENIGISDITSQKLNMGLSEYEGKFKTSKENTLLTPSVSGEYRNEALLPVQDIDIELTTKGQMKVNQVVNSHHSVFKKEADMTTKFLEQNLDMLGPGNIVLPTEELEYVNINPQKLEIVGVNAANDIHSATFDDLLQVTVDEGLMSMEDAVAYKEAQSKSRVKNLFKTAMAQSRFHKNRLAYGLNTIAAYGYTKLTQGTAALAEDFKFNTVKGQQLNAFNTTKTAKYTKAAGRVVGEFADIALIPAEIISLATNTIKYYDDPDFGAATGLGKYGIGPKELFQELLPGDYNNNDKFRNNNAATALVKSGINALAFLAMNTRYRDLRNNPEKFSPMVRPQDYDPETHGKNLRQLYFGFEFNPRGMLDGIDAFYPERDMEKTFIEKKKQPFLQNAIYALGSFMYQQPEFGSVRRKVNKNLTEKQRNILKTAGYDMLGSILSPENSANIEEDNG